MGEIRYSVKQLARLAGVSVRTLHVYDEMDLLKPSVRTDAGYRRYGEAELLRLQQILFYKELDLPLKRIGEILDDPGFDLVEALTGHKIALTARRDRLDTLLNTIDATIDHLKNKTMSDFEKLYEGMPREQAAALRQEAIDDWGEKAIRKSEDTLLGMGKERLEQLKGDQRDIMRRLRGLRKADPDDPQSDAVQTQIGRHYEMIRAFWGLTGEEAIKAKAYKGLGELYVSDERYTAEDGKPDPEFAAFMRAAMGYFADNRLE
ncbi:MAG TPA: MerR family transcriptional regulator [Puia sp.]|jgi:DNA-binding transcriptional MerR regulator|nr:MerR family transcriptional regulator [Puia sp.]